MGQVDETMTFFQPEAGVKITAKINGSYVLN